jgi:hypothetical protein
MINEHYEKIVLSRIISNRYKMILFENNKLIIILFESKSQ